MPKRKTGGRFVQEWHVKRQQQTTGDFVPGSTTGYEEFVIDCPRPLTEPRSGYWAIEIHTIEAVTDIPTVIDATIPFEASIKWAITTSPMTGKPTFMTDAGDPENIWFHSDWVTVPPGTSGGNIVGNAAYFRTRNTRLENVARYTDETGHGKLIIGNRIYLQVATKGLNWPGLNTPQVGGLRHAHISLAIEYTDTTVSCPEYVEQLESQYQVS